MSNADSTNTSFPNNPTPAHLTAAPTVPPTDAPTPPKPLQKPLQIHDYIHPTDLLPPDARPFQPQAKKSRRAADPLAAIDSLPRVRTLRLADVRARDVDWLWPNRIPTGNVTLLVGDPGVGKSLLALDLAAHLTTAKPWPDSRPHSRRDSDE